tara:strand:+ start:35271 stop:36344 length:1074 start_codon:yes stop_codon:yes gene_type:complete
MNVLQLARPEIRELAAYDAASQVADTIRLNANESPYPCLADRFRRPLNRYPEVRPAALQAALASHYQCRTEQLLVTRGSSEAIDLIIRAFCRAGKDKVVVSSPGFSMYAHYARVQGAAVVEVPSSPEQGFRIDVDALIAASDAVSRIIFLCSPNNPTGVSIPKAELSLLIESCSEYSVIVVDEAYVEFSSTDSSIELLDRYPNLLVLRTLSKAQGFAGVRCGAVAGNPAVMRMLAAIQAPYALATPVVECVEDGLDAASMMAAAERVSEMVAERERLRALIEKFGFVREVYKSDANFFLMRVADADRIVQWCKQERILLRQFGGAISDCIRVSVGSPVENDLLLQALEKLEASWNGQ